MGIVGSMRDVLISGCGVAGPTLAYWLARQGMRPTVVELSAGIRSSGNPVDVRGPAIPVVDAMGVLPQLQQSATSAVAMSIVDTAGREITRLRMPAARGGEVEVPRNDLASVLVEAARDDVEFMFSDTITGLAQDTEGVEVSFEKAAPRRFDVVVGADGLHSTVRRLAFGPEPDYVRHLGLYVATLPVQHGPEPDDTGQDDAGQDSVLLYNTPGRLVSIHPGRGQALAAFIFRSRPIPDLDSRDTARHKQILHDAYSDAGWRTPQLLGQVRDAEDLYFDSVSRIDLPSWSSGRVVLVGDAASCVSLFGEGSSLAMAGAHTLARALGGSNDYASAFRGYERHHRKLVRSKQRGAPLAAAILVPKTQIAIAIRNLAARALPSGR